MFKRAVPNRIFQDLVEQIEEAILDGKLREGDKLPPQRELCDMFQTSRGSIREALRVLEQKGLIGIKLGVNGGAIIKGINTQPVTDSLSLLIKHQRVSLDELAEFREGVEGCVAALAAERAVPSDINKLKILMVEAKNYLDMGVSYWKDFVGVEIKIHLAIAEIAGNFIFKSVLDMVHSNIFEYYYAIPLKKVDMMEENYQDLHKIIKAIENNESEKCKNLMQDHVRRFTAYMLKEKNKESKYNN